MGSFTNGVLVGLGMSLLIAPKTGKEMRQLLAERFRYLRGVPPENEELKQSVQQMAERVQQAQQQTTRAADTVVSAQQELDTLAQQAQGERPAKQPGATRPIPPGQPKRPTQ